MDETDGKSVKNTDNDEKSLDERFSVLEDHRSNTIEWSKKLDSWLSTLVKEFNADVKNGTLIEKRLKKSEQLSSRLERSLINTERDNRILRRRVKSLEQNSQDLEERVAHLEQLIRRIS